MPKLPEVDFLRSEVTGPSAYLDAEEKQGQT